VRWLDTAFDGPARRPARLSCPGIKTVPWAESAEGESSLALESGAESPHCYVRTTDVDAEPDLKKR